MILKGSVWKFGDNVDTDIIIPGRYLNITNPEELKRHCMEGVICNFYKRVKEGDVIVAGKNFGCGSSREQAPIAIKATGISCIITKTTARIFYRNALNIGLPVLESPDAWEKLQEGHEVQINLDTGEIRNVLLGDSMHARPISSFMQELIRNGGLMNSIKEMLRK